MEITYEGSQYQFPDDASDEEVLNFLKEDYGTSQGGIVLILLFVLFFHCTQPVLLLQFY